MSLRSCAIPGCQHKHLAKGFCKNHYYQRRESTTGRKCAILGCLRTHYAHGLCKLHDERWRRLGPAGLFNARPQEWRSNLREAYLAEEVAKATGISIQESTKVVDVIVGEIRDALLRDESVLIRGFGVFEMRNIRAMTGLNLKTRQPLPLPHRKFGFFRSSRDLKHFLNPEDPRYMPRGAGRRRKKFPPPVVT